MPDTDFLHLTGSCTVAEIPEQRERLLGAFRSTQGGLVIDLSGIAQADVTLVQLLVAAQVAASAQNRTLAVSAWSTAAAAAFESAGLPATMLPSAPFIQG